jgi:succinate-semialdehyde dehydrogenase/glutarate-semialdehyde dehydrogenase
MEKIFNDAGFPAGAYQNLYADSKQIEGVIADPRVQGVSLTGSERAGAAVAETAGRHLKKVVLELGGSDPFILLSTDDMDATVEAAIAGRNDNNAQACNAAKRFVVIESLYAEFLEKFTAKMLEMTPSNPRNDTPRSSLQPVRQMALKSRFQRCQAGCNLARTRRPQRNIFLWCCPH